MNFEELGEDGWKQARLFLKNKGFNLFQIDWMGKKDGEYTLFEIKKKARFIPPPFEGHGLEISQIKARLEFQKATGIKAYLLIFEPSGKIFGQYLDILQQGNYIDTKNGIRIYPLTSFDDLSLKGM